MKFFHERYPFKTECLPLPINPDDYKGDELNMYFILYFMDYLTKSSKSFKKTKF